LFPPCSLQAEVPSGERRKRRRDVSDDEDNVRRSKRAAPAVSYRDMLGDDEDDEDFFDASQFASLDVEEPSARRAEEDGDYAGPQSRKRGGASAVHEDSDGDARRRSGRSVRPVTYREPTDEDFAAVLVQDDGDMISHVRGGDRQQTTAAMEAEDEGPAGTAMEVDASAAGGDSAAPQSEGVPVRCVTCKKLGAPSKIAFCYNCAQPYHHACVNLAAEAAQDAAALAKWVCPSCVRHGVCELCSELVLVVEHQSKNCARCGLAYHWDCLINKDGQTVNKLRSRTWRLTEKRKRKERKEGEKKKKGGWGRKESSFF
jgi:hypothetical protein